MKWLLFIFGLLFFTSPAWATWSKVQNKCTGTATTTGCTSAATCALTVASTGSGHLLTATLLDDGGATSTNAITTVSGGGTWTHCSNCNANDNTNGRHVDASYVLSSTSGTTSVSLTKTTTSAGGWNWCFTEWSSSTGGIALDTGTTPSCNGTVTSSTPISCALTLSGSNVIVITGMVWSGNLTAATTPYNTDFSEQNGNGWSDAPNISSGTGAAWSPTTAGSGVNMAIAFKENAGGATCVPRLTLLHVGRCG